MLIIVLEIVVGGLVGALAVAVGAWLRRWRCDRKQLAIVASELHTKARMDALTRATMQAMRAVVREQ